jgi:hypothetical protein
MLASIKRWAERDKVYGTRGMKSWLVHFVG